MTDPRKEPDDKRQSVITGVRRRDVLKRLETLSPMPSKPPPEEPGGVLNFMLALAHTQRSDAAYAAARSEETANEIKAELDTVNARLLKLDARQDRLEERLNTVVNAQIVQGSQITELQKGQQRQEATFTGAITNVHTRIDGVVQDVARNRGEIDSLKVTFQQFRELVMADVEVRRRQLALDEAKNGTSPPTPRAAKDYPGDPEGSAGDDPAGS